MIMDRRTLLAGIAATAAAGAVQRPAFARDAAGLSGWRPLFGERQAGEWTIWQEGTGLGDAHRAVQFRSGGLIHMLGPAFNGPAKASFGHIATREACANYHLQLQYKWGARRFAPRTLQRRNSGILYHMGPERDRLFPDCVEYQVQEGDVGSAVTVNTRAVQGILLGGTPLWPNFFPGLPTVYNEPVVAGDLARQWLPHSGPYERLGGWNTLDLYAFDDQAAHLVNGRIVNTLFKIINRNGQPLTSGRIALEFEAAEITFRNIRIRNLSAEDIGRIRAGTGD